MKLLKNMFKTLLILVGILIMVAFFGFAIMMIFHVSLFGYTYVRYEKDSSVEFTAAQVATLNKIDLTTSKANVVIAYTADGSRDSMIVSNLQDFQGIFKDDVQKVDYTDPNSTEKKGGYTIKIQGGVLKIETIEPEGLYFRNDNHIKIFLPQSKSLSDLVIDSGARSIDIGNGKEFAVDNLTILAEKNKFINDVSISDKLTINNKLTLKTNLGKITINSKVLGDVEIKSNAGSISINTNVAGDVDISGNSPLVEFGHLPVDLKFNNNFDISEVKEYNIGGNLVINNCTGAGNVKVSGTVNGYVYIYSPDIEFWAKNINNGLTCNGGANNIRVFNSLKGIQSIINCGNGYLYLNNTEAEVVVQSTKDKVIINNAKNNVNVENDFGDIEVNFADGYAKEVYAKTNKGSIVANNLRGKTTLIAEGGNITANFKAVVNVNDGEGENLVKAKYYANVTVVDNITYNFTAKAKTAGVDVRLGSVIYNNWSSSEEDNGWKVKTDTINSTGSGSLCKLLVWVTDNGKITAKMPTA